MNCTSIKLLHPPPPKEGGGQRKKAQSKHPVPRTEYVIVSPNSIIEILREIRLAPKPLLQNVITSFTSSISDRVLRERIQETRVLGSTMVKQRNTKRSKKHHTGSRYGRSLPTSQAGPFFHKLTHPSSKGSQGVRQPCLTDESTPQPPLIGSRGGLTQVAPIRFQSEGVAPICVAGRREHETVREREAVREHHWPAGGVGSPETWAVGDNDGGAEVAWHPLDQSPPTFFF